MRLEQGVPCVRNRRPVPWRRQDGRWLEFVISPASASPSHCCSCAVVSETGLAVHSSANCFDKRLIIRCDHQITLSSRREI